MESINKLIKEAVNGDGELRSISKKFETESSDKKGYYYDVIVEVKVSITPRD